MFYFRPPNVNIQWYFPEYWTLQDQCNLRVTVTLLKTLPPPTPHPAPSPPMRTHSCTRGHARTTQVLHWPSFVQLLGDLFDTVKQRCHGRLLPARITSSGGAASKCITQHGARRRINIHMWHFYINIFHGYQGSNCFLE